MRLDEIEFEQRIKDCSEYLKETFRKSRKQALDEHNAWLVELKTNPDALHPLEKMLNFRINWTDGTR